jgi:hypothetical protein
MYLNVVYSFHIELYFLYKKVIFNNKILLIISIAEENREIVLKQKSEIYTLFQNEYHIFSV